MSIDRPIEHVINRLKTDQPLRPDVTRQAVRGVVLRNGLLLMVYSPVNGDYKFPGGGVESGESHTEALFREILEETGERGTGTPVPLARVREYGEATESGTSIFLMDSFYYTVAVEIGGRTRQSLAGYEQHLGFAPRWVTLAEAIDANEATMRRTNEAPLWTERETWVLRKLLNVQTESSATII